MTSTMEDAAVDLGPPRADEDVEVALSLAVGHLITTWNLPYESGALESHAARLHVQASLRQELDRKIADTVAATRSHPVSWAKIGRLLGVTRTTAWERYSGKAKR